MNLLNLTEGFAPLGRVSEIEYRKFKFPSGELHFQLLNNTIKGNVATITTRITNGDDLLLLLLAVDTLKYFQGIKLYLYLPFLPFARQDRINESGECFSLKTLANILNVCNFTQVFFYDVHSDVAKALINGAKNITNRLLVEKVLLSKRNNYYIICPDIGAHKKIFKLAKEIGHTKDIILCNKVRNTADGKITGTEILKPLPELNQTYYIIDDICDGGATFIGIAEEIHKLDETATVNLIVSHGIFSKGVEHLLDNGINEIYTTDSLEQRNDVPNLFITNLINIME